MMDWYIADTHFGHASMIEKCGRPFTDVEEMDALMVSAWNNRVRDDDDVWIVGDICHHHVKRPEEYLKRLAGKKHLIVGNHDDRILRSERAVSLLESVDYAVDRVDGENHHMLLVHYPLLEPPRERWVVYGHVHNHAGIDGFSLLKTQRKSVNVCADVNGWVPVTFEEALANTRRWYAENK